MKKSENLSRSQLFLIAAVLITGLTLSLVGSNLLFSYAIESQKLWIEHHAKSHAEEMQLRINAALESLTSVAALFYAYDEVEQKQFSKFVEVEAATHTGTLLLAWVPHLLHKDRQQFEKTLPTSLYKIKRISEFNAHGLLGPSPTRDEYFPVQYYVSTIKSELFPGLNLGSFYKTRKRLNTAIETNTLLTTKRIALDGNNQNQTFRAFLPVYNKEPKAMSPNNVREQLAGFAMGQFDIEALSVSETETDQLLHMTLLDIDAAPDEQLLFTTKSIDDMSTQIQNLNDLSETTQLYWTRYFNVGNRKWLAVYSPREDLPRQTSSLLPYAGLVLGILITSLLAIYLFIAQWRTQQVNLLTKESSEKSRFLQAVSHDLRQPLNTLGLFVSQLHNKNNNQYDEVVVSKLKQTLNSLNNMFDTLLDITRLEASVIRPKKQHFRLQTLLNNLADEFEINAEDKDLEFRLHVTDLVVYTDPILLERILRNFIVNAIRYTQHGKILLASRQQGSNIKIFVMDTGPGIDSRQLDDMFNPYVRGTTIFGEDSLGLGLAIVKQTSDLLGHTLYARSELGRGSIFGIIVPMGNILEVKGEEQAKHVNTVDFTNKHILLVEDDINILQATQQLLYSWGCKVTACTTIKEALSVSEYDLILADYNLPDGNGLQLIKSLGKNNKSMAIIITSDLDEDIPRQVKDSGYEFLRKPVHPLKLRSLFSYIFFRIN